MKKRRRQPAVSWTGNANICKKQDPCRWRVYLKVIASPGTGRLTELITIKSRLGGSARCTRNLKRVETGCFLGGFFCFVFPLKSLFRSLSTLNSQMEAFLIRRMEAFHISSSSSSSAQPCGRHDWQVRHFCRRRLSLVSRVLSLRVVYTYVRRGLMCALFFFF